MISRVLRIIRTEWILLSNAGSVWGATIIASFLGVAYWWLAARLFSPTLLGLNSAAISAMMLLTEFGMVGLGTLLIGEIHRRPDQMASLIVSILLVIGIISFLLGLLFAMIAPFLSSNLGAIGVSSTSILLFGIGVVITGFGMVIDQALIGLLHSELNLLRNVLFSIFKLILLVPFGLLLNQRIALAIYVSWGLGGILSFAGIIPYVKRTWKGIDAYKPNLTLLRGLSKSALLHHLLNIALRAPVLIMPVMVTILLSPEKNAAFYIAWLIANFLFQAPNALSTVLYSVGTKHDESLKQKLRFTLRISFLIGLAANLVLFIFASPILSIFGRGYADEAAWSLRIMALGVFPVIIKAHYVAVSRITDNIARAIMFRVPIAVLEIIFGAIGAKVGGLAGLSSGWILALCIEASVTYSIIHKVLRKPDLDLVPVPMEGF